MIKRNRPLGLLGTICLLLLFFSLSSVLGTGFNAEDSTAALIIDQLTGVQSVPPASSDWVISSGESFIGIEYIINGSIIINSPESVVFDSVTLSISGEIVFQTDNHRITNSSITFTQQKGIVLDHAEFIEIADNSIICEHSDHTLTVVSLIQSHNNTIKNNFIQGSGEGVQLDNSDKNHIAHNNIKSLSTTISDWEINGFDVYASKDNSFINNSLDIKSNTPAIHVRSTSDNNLFHQNIIDGWGNAFHFTGGSHHNVFSYNEVDWAVNGIEMWGPCSNNTWIYNSFKGLHRGVELRSDSFDNYFAHNEIRGGEHKGLEIQGSHTNTFISNSISSSSDPAITLSSDSKNNLFCLNSISGDVVDSGEQTHWDYNELGNFWDVTLGPDTDSDGIADNPYEIYGSVDAIDYFPLMATHRTTGVILNHPSDITIADDATDKAIKWMCYSGNAFQYRFRIDDSPTSSATQDIGWRLSDFDITFDCTELSIGTHQVTLQITLLSQTYSDSVIVTVMGDEASATSTQPTLETPGFGWISLFVVLIFGFYVFVQRKRRTS